MLGKHFVLIDVVQDLVEDRDEVQLYVHGHQNIHATLLMKQKHQLLKSHLQHVILIVPGKPNDKHIPSGAIY